jgi:DNA-binding response OmpR family regulator
MERKKILIVEDQEDIRDIIRFYLESEGYDVIQTDRGEDVIRMMESEKPDLITLDVMLPGIDGFELLRIIKCDPRPEISEIPVIIVSVLARDTNKYQHGFADFISKPFEKYELIDAVKRVLAEVEKDKELSKRILVVDDEEDIVNIITFYLKNLGYESITASNGEEAIAKAKQEKPDLIILDVQMPKLNGFEVIKILKQDENLWSIPIIILTGTHISEEDRKHGLKLGASKYITKPFDSMALVNDIKELLCGEQKS